APDRKSRVSRWLAMRLEPLALAAADGVTAVSTATYAQALERHAIARPGASAELPIGWDDDDFAFLRTRSRRATPLFSKSDGLVPVVYVGTLLPTGLDTLRALLGAVSQWRRRDRSNAGCLRLHFVGTSNQRSGGAPRVLPIARELGLADI